MDTVMIKITLVKNQILSVLRGEAEAAAEAAVMEHHAAFTFPLARVLVMACCAACSAASFKCFSMYVWYIGCMTCEEKIEVKLSKQHFNQMLQKKTW